MATEIEKIYKNYKSGNCFFRFAEKKGGLFEWQVADKDNQWVATYWLSETENALISALIEVDALRRQVQYWQEQCQYWQETVSDRNREIRTLEREFVYPLLFDRE
jgi:hypothetical protein